MINSVQSRDREDSPLQGSDEIFYTFTKFNTYVFNKF